MSLFSVCQLRLMGVLTLKTGQKGIGKKKQQPLLKQSDAKCHRTKIQVQFRELTCKMCTLWSSETWLKCNKVCDIIPRYLITSSFSSKAPIYFFKALRSLLAVLQVCIIQCNTQWHFADHCSAFPISWKCIYLYPFQDILSFYISPLCLNRFRLKVWLKAAFGYPDRHQSSLRREQRH